GANIGYFSLLASRAVGARGRVIAIEPNSENSRLILINAMAGRVENLQLLPIALAEAAGWSYFATHVGSNGGFRPGMESDLRDGRGSVVPTFPLDGLVNGPVHLLKVDVEGAEGLVFRGARRTIERYRPIVLSELSCEMLQRVSGMPAGEYLQAFVDLGYTINVIDPDKGKVLPYASPAQLLEAWSDPLAIEDLLLLPQDR
ncbi:MAG: FkbM family methyltransferase, partial [Actinobacteria bacterium]|nr:FkbM family methyltransferase [Actinomycetota bacterium]